VLLSQYNNYIKNERILRTKKNFKKKVKMQNLVNPALNKCLNMENNKPEGRTYQISPFGVILQPISLRPQSAPLSPVPNSPPLSPMSPSQILPVVSKEGTQNFSLTPLSCGGYIYQPNFIPPQSPPQPPPIFSPQIPPSPHFMTNAPQFVSSEIAERQKN